MEKIISLNKQRLGGLGKKWLIKTYEAWSSIPAASRKEYLPFEIYRKKICRTFCLTKHEAMEILSTFVDLGFVEIIKFRGIKLNFSVKNEQ